MSRGWQVGCVVLVPRTRWLSRSGATQPCSQPRVDRLALERQYREGAFVHPAQRLARDEACQPLVAERELVERELALAGKAAPAQPLDVLRRVVFRAVDDAQIFPAAHLQGRLDEAFRAA